MPRVTHFADDATIATLEQQARRIAELEEALRHLAEACFAEMGDGRDDGEPDDASVFVGVPDGQGITFGMIRRAMAVLEKR